MTYKIIKYKLSYKLMIMLLTIVLISVGIGGYSGFALSDYQHGLKEQKRIAEVVSIMDELKERLGDDRNL